MVGVAVELDDELVGWPEGVDLVAALDDGIRLRAGDSMSVEEGEEAVLELGAGGLMSGRAEVGERFGELRCPRVTPSPRACERAVDRRDVEFPESIGLRQALGELVGRQDRGQVDQRAGQGRDRDPVEFRDVVVGQHAPPIDLNPQLARALPDCRDVDPRRVRGPNAVQHGGMPMTQHRTGADGQHRREPKPLPSELSMPDGVDARVELHEPPVGKPNLDHRGCDAGCQDLPPGDHTVLAVGKLRNRTITMRSVSLHLLYRCRFTVLGHAAHSGGRGRTVGAWFVAILWGSGVGFGS